MNRNLPNFEVLKAAAKQAAQNAHDDLDAQEQKAAYTDATEYSFYRHHQEVDEELEFIITMISKAKGAETTGNLQRADHLVEKAHSKISGLSIMGPTWDTAIHHAPTGPGPFEEIIEFFDKVLKYIVGLIAKLQAPVNPLSRIEAELKAFDDQSTRYNKLRKVANYYEIMESQELTLETERRIDRIGYETDAIADGSGLAGKMIFEKYEKIHGLIDQAEAAEQRRNLDKANEFLKEAKRMLAD